MFCKLKVILVASLMSSSSIAAEHFDRVNDWEYKNKNENGILSFSAGTRFVGSDGFFDISCLDMRPVKNLCAQLAKRPCDESELLVHSAGLPLPYKIGYRSKITTVKVGNNKSPYFITDVTYYGNLGLFFGDQKTFYFDEILEILNGNSNVNVEVVYKKYASMSDLIDANDNYETHRLKYSIDPRVLKPGFDYYYKHCQ
ncbi:hypothetical protein [Photobacterium marinum]|uniref:hypothetical protein n=1 Tax=Photobacterium marinum TaxID=1056511 RepID=UPI000559DB72|nr:hypothetical protein [Photobacterium marinum]